MLKVEGREREESKIATSSAAEGGGRNKFVENTSVLYSGPINLKKLMALLPWERIS